MDSLQEDFTSDMYLPAFDFSMQKKAAGISSGNIFS
jgi:hypothetical protein